jgi:hypothetical protein
MTHSESVHLCAELKTGILAVPTDTDGLGYSYRINDHHCHAMLNFIDIIMFMLNCYFIILITMNHKFINGIRITLMLLNC